MGLIHMNNACKKCYMKTQARMPDEILKILMILLKNMEEENNVKTKLSLNYICDTKNEHNWIDKYVDD